MDMTQDINSSLFEPEMLQKIDWENVECRFKGGVSPTNPGDNLQLRPLALLDYQKGYMDLLSQLTNIGEVTQEVYENRFHEMKKCKDTYYISVLEDLSLNVIIGSATLVLEQKFIHSAAHRGRIEDVVVYEGYRGKQLGKLLVQTLTLLGKKLGCYKLSLECNENKVQFYESFGYKRDGQHFMVQRFDTIKDS